jgi:hypothetical protein
MLIFEINVLHKLQNERNRHPINRFIPAYLSIQRVVCVTVTFDC